MNKQINKPMNKMYKIIACAIALLAGSFVTSANAQEYGAIIVNGNTITVNWDAIGLQSNGGQPYELKYVPERFYEDGWTANGYPRIVVVPARYEVYSNGALLATYDKDFNRLSGPVFVEFSEYWVENVDYYMNVWGANLTEAIQIASGTQLPPWNDPEWWENEHIGSN